MTDTPTPSKPFAGLEPVVNAEAKPAVVATVATPVVPTTPNPAPTPAKEALPEASTVAAEIAKTQPTVAPVVAPAVEKQATIVPPHTNNSGDVVSPVVLTHTNNSGSVNNPEPVVDEDEVDEAPKMDELSFLKNRANMMGILYSNNIGIDALRDKINAKLAGEVPKADTVAEANATSAALQGELRVDKENPGKAVSLRQRLMNENMRLIRLRITNLDPKKKDLPGEILTVANEYIGTVSKFVPFGEVTDGGYHVPYVIYKRMTKRKFLNIKTRKGKNGQQDVVEHSWAQEFALEVLPQLDETQLAKLAASQAAAAGVSN
jgi:hypothetical protein